jgi:hypothetical protein
MQSLIGSNSSSAHGTATLKPSQPTAPNAPVDIIAVERQTIIRPVQEARLLRLKAQRLSQRAPTVKRAQVRLFVLRYAPCVSLEFYLLHWVRQPDRTPVRSQAKWGLSHAQLVRRGRRVRQAVCLGMGALTFLSVQVRQASCSTWCCPTAVTLLPRLCNQILGLAWPLRPRRGANVRLPKQGDYQDHSGACSCSRHSHALVCCRRHHGGREHLGAKPAGTQLAGAEWCFEQGGHQQGARQAAGGTRDVCFKSCAFLKCLQWQ